MNKEKCIEIGAAIAKMNQINNKLEFFYIQKDTYNAILPDLLLESRIQIGKIIAGVDNNNVFKEGHVYSFIKIEGVIVCEDLGEHAEQENFKFRRFWEIMMEGIYLLTKKEYKSIKNGK